jgi:adenylosuccinate synthase
VVSDRAHIVFDFHQAVDGLNEGALGGQRLGTTHKGIGPAYCSKAMRNGLRVGDLRDMPFFEDRLARLVAQLTSAYPALQIDLQAEIDYYRSIRDIVLPMVKDTVLLCNSALDNGENILVEGANATSNFIILLL